MVRTRGSLMLLSDAARVSGRDASTLRHSIRRGSLEGVKINGAWYVSTGALEKYDQAIPTRVGSIRRKWKKLAEQGVEVPGSNAITRDYNIFLDYINTDLSFEQLAEKHGLSRQRIRQIVVAVDEDCSTQVQSK